VLLGIQHSALVVSDLERSRRFYGGAIGMEELERPQTFTFRGAWFRAGSEELHLILAEDTTSPAGWKEPGKSALTGLAAHVALEVDDLAAARARLDGNGIGLFTGPLERGDGIVQVYVRDPDGHLIELFERTGDDQSGAAERAPVRG
jgi:glyoxylase I family protein